MPEITTVMNIEFETKRKFYYYSDDMINGLNYIQREDVPEPMKRLYKIIDNKNLFLDYLTEKTLYFNSSWWERLRNTKLEGLKLDEKLIRQYSSNLDERLVKVRSINSIATTAIYNDKVQSDFLADISDLLSNLNDNHKQGLKFSIFTEDGEILEDIKSELLMDYHIKKIIKNRRLKNRKKENVCESGHEDETANAKD